jgi:subtilisin family serine protease
MKKNLFKLFAVVMIFLLTVAPVSAKDASGDFSKTNFSSGSPTKLPQEIIDEFDGGMSIEEFLIRNQGPIPNALLQYADLKVTVIVQMERPSLIAYMDQIDSTPAEMPASTQQSYVQTLKASQRTIIAKVTKLGGTVMGQYTKTMNGFMVRVPAKELNAIRLLPGVKDVRRAPQHEINLSHSVPLINADDIWNMLPVGFEGTDITIAVIDSGIDYTHAMFGGSGDPLDYSANDPVIIETDTFPTTKVIGGYDFAGTNYDADSDDPLIYTPVPDPDPLDENGHGTHVASTIAGVDVGFGSGVAPAASLYALKIFGAAGSTNLVVDAIEWAMDPNGDNDTSDHVDVINLSLGSDFGPNDVNDPELIAVEAASQAGVFVVASAGNAGNSSYIVGSPSVSDSALSVAASSTGFQTSPYIVYNDGEEKWIPYITSANPFTTAITAEMIDVSTLEASGLFCNENIGSVPVDALSGKIALISRGVCSFAEKINNAESFGALAAIIYHNEAGVLSMVTDGSTLPAGSILQSDGAILTGLTPTTVTVGPDTNVSSFEAPYPADSIAIFSSRGPRGFDSKLKPEITAPGVEIFAANIGSGDQGVSYSGTSMAAPHVAGVAALIKEAHPLWTNEQIKAAIMNTATTLVDIGADVPRQGAGRVDAYAALNTDVVAVGDPNLVSLSWGVIEVTTDTFQDVKTITLYNFSDVDKTLDVIPNFTSVDTGATLTPSVPQVIVPALGSTSIEVTLDLDATLLPLNFPGMEEYYGYVTFIGAGDNLRVPFYFVPRPYTVLVEDDSETTFDIETGSGYVDLTQSGPQASKLNAYPVFLVDENEVDVLDAGDLRYVGLNYWGIVPTYGDLLVSVFSMWGPVHTNQSYFSEVNMFIDADQDGNPELVDFNYNLGAFDGYDDTNTWVVAQVNLDDDSVILGSPFSIDADFNSGFQAWYLPTASPYLGLVDTALDYEVKSIDWNGVEDYVGTASFDYAKTPLIWDLTDDVPDNTSFTLDFSANDVDGYYESKLQGIMLVDYFGKPGLGQVYYWPLNVPVALDQNLSTDEDVPLNITLTGNGLLPGPVVWTIESDPVHGTLSGDAPDLVYTPNSDWHGPDAFTFSVNNGIQDSNIATIEIVVSSEPVALDQNLTTDEDVPLNLTLTGTGLLPGPVEWTIESDPEHGLLSGTAPDLIYTPEADWFGTDSFTFSVNDGLQDSNTATIEIVVAPVDDPPVALGQNLSTDEDVPLNITLTGTGLLPGPVVWTIESDPAHGILSGDAPDLVYTPNSDWHGTDSFTFSVNDGIQDSNVATIEIDVSSEPVALDQNLSTDEDVPLNITLTGTGLLPGPTVWTIESDPEHGSLSGTAPNLIYTPDFDWHGTDSFTFSVNDGIQDSNIATIEIDVSSEPVALDQNLTTDEDVPLNLTLTGTGLLPGPVVWTIESDPEHGLLSGTAPDLIYTPEADWFGTDSFTFSVNDGLQDSNIATIEIVVSSVDDPPVALDQNLSTDEDVPLNITLTGTGLLPGPAVWTIESDPEHGLLSGTAPDLIYTSEADWFGTDSFTFLVNDGLQDSNIATIEIVVSPIDDVPVAEDQDVLTTQNTPIEITLIVNDLDDDEITYIIVDEPVHGTLEFEPGELPILLYVPDLDWYGEDSFTFKGNDGFGDSNIATVTIAVNQSNWKIFLPILFR